MQEFLEYLTLMLNFADKDSSEKFQGRILEEIAKHMENLTVEELECLDSVFDGYELFFQREANATEELIELYKEFDNRDEIIKGFAVELARLEKNRRKTEAQIQLFAKVCDIAYDRKEQLRRL